MQRLNLQTRKFLTYNLFDLRLDRNANCIVQYSTNLISTQQTLKVLILFKAIFVKLTSKYFMQKFQYYLKSPKLNTCFLCTKS